jgi:ribosomal protein L16 Arg81 hydroxylase
VVTTNGEDRVFVPTVAEVIGDEDEFFTRYFNIAPVVRRGAISGDPREILSVADLDEVLSSEAIRPPYVDIARDGKTVPTSAYTDPVVVQREYVTDRVLPERVAALFRAGATVTWNSLNHYRPNLRALAASLSTLFASQCDVIAFLTPAGRRGLAPHYDPVDVFVIQLEGTKSWRVWPVPEPRPGDDAGNLNESALGEPALEVTLAPGDVLYLPYNCAHVAYALDSVSLHLSLSIAPRRWGALLRDTVAALVKEDPAFWGNPWLRDKRTADELPAMLELLAERLRGLDPVATVDRLITEGTARDGTVVSHHLRDAAAADAVAPEQLVTRAESVPVQVIEHGPDKVRAKVGDAVYLLPSGVLDALDALTGGRTVAAGALLAGASANLSTRTARTLIRIGVLRTT